MIRIQKGTNQLIAKDFISCFKTINNKLESIFNYSKYNYHTPNQSLEIIDNELYTHFDLINITNIESECVENIVKTCNMIINGKLEI